MDYRQPAAGQRAANEPATAFSQQPMSPMNSVLSKILTILLILAALGLIGYLLTRVANTVTSTMAVKKDQYQAVFLTNGQVYFGKVSKVDSGYVTLKDIYYLQVSGGSEQQTVQPTSNNTTANAADQQVSLAKLGSELHGPEDAMFVSRDQILFWENLKSDGKVGKAIADFKNK